MSAAGFKALTILVGIVFSLSFVWCGAAFDAGLDGLAHLSLRTSVNLAFVAGVWTMVIVHGVIDHWLTRCR